jgi:hypothetical protein
MFIETFIPYNMIKIEMKAVYLKNYGPKKNLNIKIELHNHELGFFRISQFPKEMILIKKS